MDIQIASNFERYLYYLLDENGFQLRVLMQSFANGHAIQVPLKNHCVDPLFAAGMGDSAATLAAIRDCRAAHNYLLDPHTAVGFHVARSHISSSEPMVCLATAHPAKFGDAIKQAIGRDITHHPLLDALADKPTRCEDVTADVEALKSYIINSV